MSLYLFEFENFGSPAIIQDGWIFFFLSVVSNLKDKIILCLPT